MEDPHTVARHGSRARDNARNHHRQFLSNRGKSPGPMQSDDDALPQKNDLARRKRHGLVPPLAGPSSSHIPVDEPVQDRAAKPQMRHRTRPVPDFALTSTLSPRPPSKGKKEKSKETHRYPPRSVNLPSEDEDEGTVDPAPQATYTGPLAAAEFSRLKKELEILRKQTNANAKSFDKQAKAIVDLKRDLIAANKTLKERNLQIEELKSKVKQSDELISSIESTLQCQICMDTLAKPHALSPCGHVLCQTCLQEWFRAAPVNEDDMYIDDAPLIFRKKSCPCCRATVLSRPLPVFLVKSLISTLDRAKAPAGAHEASPPPDLDDPWADIFPPPRGAESEDSDQDDADDDDDEEDDEEEEGFSDDLEVWDVEDYDEYADTSDDEYEGPYVEPFWEPPHHWLDDLAIDDFADPDTFRMIRRGATGDMIEYYGMLYSHEKGLVAHSGGMTIYLGFNIDLSEGDVTGERFMDWLMEDMDNRPDRWKLRAGTATKLVRGNEVVEYETSDSDADFDDDDEEE